MSGLIAFYIIKKTHGLRCTVDEEIAGLDKSEHGLPSAYADFAPAVASTYSFGGVSAPAVTGDTPIAEAIPVTKEELPVAVQVKEPTTGVKMTKLEIVCKESRFEGLKNALMELGVTGMTVSHVMGCGMQKGTPEYYRGVPIEVNLLPKIQVDVVVSKIPVSAVIDATKRALYTGHIGDGKIFIYDVENVVKVRTGEEGYDALQDVE